MTVTSQTAHLPERQGTRGYLDYYYYYFFFNALGCKRPWAKKKIKEFLLMLKIEEKK
jgi:hypothetical protein